MKLYVKIPGGGELIFERKSSDGEWIVYLVAVLCIAAIFWAVWALR